MLKDKFRPEINAAKDMFSWVPKEQLRDVLVVFENQHGNRCPMCDRELGIVNRDGTISLIESKVDDIVLCPGGHVWVREIKGFAKLTDDEVDAGVGRLSKAIQAWQQASLVRIINILALCELVEESKIK